MNGRQPGILDWIGGTVYAVAVSLGAATLLGMLLCGLGGASFFLSGLLVLGLIFGGFAIGDRRGSQALTEANDKEREARKTLEAASDAKNEAVQHEASARKLLKKARRTESAADTKFVAAGEMIEMANSLPLENRLQAALTVGRMENESDIDYRSRLHDLVQLRMEQWRSAKRFGHSLLPIVEHQGGLCGDPAKDPVRKGCGCFLCCLPPTAVHLDHVLPKSAGGSDKLDNMQALCSACNISAGATFDLA